WPWLLFGRNINEGPDQNERPENEAEDQRRPATDCYRLSPRMSALACDLARCHADRDEDRNYHGNKDEQDDPGEDIDKGHDTPRAFPKLAAAAIASPLERW